MRNYKRFSLDPIGKMLIAKPHPRYLIKKGMVVADLHSHSIHSDGNASVKTLLRVARLRKIAFSITDHNEIKGSLIASRQKKVKVIPGVEVTSNMGRDLLCYFYDFRDLRLFYAKYVMKNKINHNPFSLDRSLLRLSEEELIEGSRDFNGVISMPHPFGFPYRGTREFYAKMPKLLRKIQGMEVINSIIDAKRNRPAFNWAKETGKALTAGSDTHTRFGLGRALTVSWGNSVSDLLDAIRKKETGVLGKELPFWARVTSAITVVKNNI